jgi:LPXTG-site transpeptidase (sortase) family protein
LSDLISPSSPQTHRIRWLLVAGGLTVLLAAVLSQVNATRVYHSPLDEIDQAEMEADQGFVPIYAAENPQGAVENAPTLEPEGEQAVHSGATPTLPAATPTPRGQPGTAAGSRPTLPFPTLTLTPLPEYIPDRIVIPAIGVDEPVVAVSKREVEAQGQLFEQWIAPKRAAGWHNTSATLGMPGNTVINGHHNTYGEVFRDVHTLIEGDQILVYSGEHVFVYRVGLSLRLNERFRPVTERLQNAQWVLPSQDERLTLITCWPYESNTHRVVVVAMPVEMQDDLR